VIFETKSKVYAFANKTWNNFAQGNLKINKNKNNNKCRLILRKEGGLTLALNAPIFPHMLISKQGDKGVVFPVAESQSLIVQYVAKFQTIADTENFYTKLQECLSDVTTG